MFRSDLKDRLQKIFGFRKTTFAAPSESFEQDTLFIEILSIKGAASRGGKARAIVEGTMTVFAEDEKLPYGFFHKKIEQDKKKLSAPILFFDIDQNVTSSMARLQNISERRTKFVFLYSEQYDPNQGQLTSLKTEEIENG